MTDIFENIADMQKNIQPLNINGLIGRMLRLPASNSKNSNKEILLLYGHHSSIERMYGIAEVFAECGNVTMPDFPGFGGMDSFYEIGMKPTLDNLADYLATFVKLRYKRKKVTIIGMSLGFVIATRMLQKYPDLVKRVKIIVSVAGFAHYSDFTFSKSRVFTYKIFTRLISWRIPSWLFFNLCLHPSVIKAVYAKSFNAKKKFSGFSKKELKQNLEFEVILWRDNDVRTYMLMGNTMLNLDNCKSQIDLPVHHLAVENDQYFNNKIVEQHMQVIFNDYFEYRIKLPNHAPSIIASKEEAKPFIAKGLKKVLV